MKEKILVIKPPHPHQMFPLGMSYVLSCLEKHGIDFDFYDAQFGGDYTKLIKKNEYYAIATGGLIAQYKFFIDVARYVRETSPGIPLILGGGITSDLRPDFLFDKLNFTYGIIGEAETSFPFLVDALLHKKTGFEAIPGLLYKDPATGEIKKNPMQRFDLATSDILPAWHRFNVDFYINNWEHGIFGHRSLMPIISARGCMGACTFCSHLKGAFRKRPIDQVIREIEIMSERYTFDWLGFYNEMFYSTKEEIVDFCEAFKSLKLRKNWSCDMRVDADVDIDTFKLMKDAGCVAIFGGLESGSNKVLSRMQKRTTREMIISFYRTAQAAAMPCIGGFMVGNEGETEADIKETVDMVTIEKMRTIEALVSTYPGTKIYENAKKRGLIGDEWDYLEHLDSFADIWDCSTSKKGYLNISDIPNDRFLETVVSELRRFNTFNLTHFVPKHMSYSQKLGILLKVTGTCSECGSAVTVVTPRKTLGIQTFCGNCFRTVEFNFYEMPEYTAHFQWLCVELQKANSLAVVGTKTEATNFLKYDYFKLDYRSLVAFVETDGKASGVSDFCHLPRVRMEGLPVLMPDALLVVDDPFGNCELKIRKFYLQKNLPTPRILQLLPDKKRPYARCARFAERHGAPSGFNKFFVIPVLLVPIAIADLQAWFIQTAKSHYEALNKNAVIRLLLKLMQLHR
jgi:anaerobic magnesium-protoporphyrin IX monomethyl ester cyclase